MQCPCCDFSCPSMQNLLVHVQLHFLFQLDMDTLQTMMDDNGQGSPESSDKDSSENVSSEKHSPREK